MKMKRMLCALSALLLLALCACGGGDDDKSTPTNSVYHPGTYTAEADGQNPGVKVTITIDSNDKITDVQIDASGETPDIGGKVPETMIPAIKEAQSASVDVVANATLTSNAIIKALQDCLSQAANG